MIKLPMRVPQAGSGFVPAAYQQIQVPSGAFDSGGQAMEAMGESLTKVSKDLDDINQIMERDAVTESMTSFDRFAREQLNGTGEEGSTGYLGQYGKGAVESYDTIQKSLNDERQRLRDSLPSGRARRLFDSVTESTRQSTSSMMDAHRRQQVNSVRLETSRSAANEMADTYAVTADIPGLGQLAWDSGGAEAAHAVFLDPQPGMTAEEAARNWYGMAAGKRVEYQLRKGDTAGAEQTLKQHQDIIPPDVKSRTEGQIRTAKTDQAIQTVSAPYIAMFQDWSLYAGRTPPVPANTPNANGSPPSTTTAPSPDQAIGPEKQDQYLGLPPLQAIYARAERDPAYQALSEEDKVTFRNTLNHQYAREQAQARQQYAQNVTLAWSEIKGGKSCDNLPPAIRNGLSPRTKAAAIRLQEITSGQRNQETDIATASHLAHMSPAELSRRILDEDMPFLSPAMGVIFKSISADAASTDPHRAMKAQSYLQTLAYMSDAFSAGNTATISPHDLDAISLQAVMITDRLIKEKRAVTRDELRKGLSGLVFETKTAEINRDQTSQPLSEVPPYPVNTVAQLAGIPVQLSGWALQDFKNEHKRTPTYHELGQFYRQRETSYYQKVTGQPIEAIQKILLGLRQSGQEPDFLTVRQKIRDITPAYDPYAAL